MVARACKPSTQSNAAAVEALNCLDKLFDRHPKSLASRRLIQSAYSAASEAIQFVRSLIVDVPETRRLLLRCALESVSCRADEDDFGVTEPWILSLRECLDVEAPPHLRIQACHVISTVLDGLPVGDYKALDSPIVSGPSPSLSTTNRHTSAGAQLAQSLIQLEKEVSHFQPRAVPAVLAALRVLAGASMSAKHELLRSGFIALVIMRMGDSLGAMQRQGKHRFARRSSSNDSNFADQDVHVLRTILIEDVRLLSNTVAGCEEAKLTCVSLQLPRVLLSLWTASRSDLALRRLVLVLICNYISHCSPAKSSLAAYSDVKGRCVPSLLIQSVIVPLRKGKTPMRAADWKQAWQCLGSLATASESRTLLLRSPLPTRASNVAGALLVPPASDEARSAPVFDFLANFTFEADGQAALLHTDGAFDTVLEGLASRDLNVRRAAALCLRNLAFHSDGKASIMAKPRALPLLVAGIDRRDAQLASTCSSALWAFLSHCERAKVALRHGDLIERVIDAEKALVSNAMRKAEEDKNVSECQQKALRNMSAISIILGLESQKMAAA